MKTSARTRCTRIALSVPSRVMQPYTPFSTKQSQSLISRLSSMVDHRVSGSTTTHKGPVRGSCPCCCDACPSSSKKTNATQCPYGRSALANPTRLILEQKKKNNSNKQKRKNKNKTAPTDIHVVCKQPKLQYGIERVLSLNS